MTGYVDPDIIAAKFDDLFREPFIVVSLPLDKNLCCAFHVIFQYR